MFNYINKRVYKVKNNDIINLRLYKTGKTT